MNDTELQRLLQARGLMGNTPLTTPPTAIDATADRHARPLAIGLLLGLSGWVAGLFLLLFVALLLQPTHAGSAAVLGLLLLASAWGLFKIDDDGAQLFVAQLALALSIAGQCLMLYAMSDRAHGLAGVAAAALLLQAVLAFVMPNRLHRTLCTLFATIAWALTLRFALFGEPGFWHADTTVRSTSTPSALMGWALAWLPVGAGLVVLIRSEPHWMARGWQPLLRPIASGLIVGLAFATLASQPIESFRWFGSGEVDVGALALWPLLSALGALGAVAAAFALRQRALMGACVVAALLHVSHFYDALGTSLLVKSMLMAAMGGAMLLAARALAAKEAA